VSGSLLGSAVICFSFDLILCIEWDWELALSVGWRFGWDLLYFVVGDLAGVVMLCSTYFNLLHLALYFILPPSLPFLS